MPQDDRYQPVEDAFREGRIEATDSATLSKYLHALSNQPIPNESVRHRDIIRGITINHLLLQRHIADLDRKNSTTQKLVVALTIAALLSSGAQIWYAMRADERAATEAIARENFKLPTASSVHLAQPNPTIGAKTQDVRAPVSATMK